VQLPSAHPGIGDAVPFTGIAVQLEPNVPFVHPVGRHGLPGRP